MTKGPAQVMNYGLGGSIRVHTDVKQSLKPWDDNLLYGGQRLLTYMLYLSTVQVTRTEAPWDSFFRVGGRCSLLAK